MKCSHLLTFVFTYEKGGNHTSRAELDVARNISSIIMKLRKRWTIFFDRMMYKKLTDSNAKRKNEQDSSRTVLVPVSYDSQETKTVPRKCRRNGMVELELEYDIALLNDILMQQKLEDLNML